MWAKEYKIIYMEVVISLYVDKLPNVPLVLPASQQPLHQIRA